MPGEMAAAPVVAPVAAAAAAPPTIVRSEQGALLTVVSPTAQLRVLPADNAGSLLNLERGATVVLSASNGELHGWRAVAVGTLKGWVRASEVQPLNRGDGSAAASPSPVAATGSVTRASPQPVVVSALDADVSANARRYRVQVDQLPLRVAPDGNAGSVLLLAKDETVFAGNQAQQGAWLAVAVLRNGAVQRGWVPVQWVLPLQAQPSTQEIKP
jgi:hypothetical protein